jgi:TM2 domain-containing membrane protein YozV
MNCYLHTDTPATAYCTTCGKALCNVCQQRRMGTVFCPEHAPAAAAPDPANPYAGGPLPPPGGAKGSPGLAFLLGLIPGVGAIYNAQYVKGLVHALIFGLLISFSSSADGTAGEPFLAVLAMVFYFYMPFEAYHTARKRLLGLPVDEWSSVIPPQHLHSRTPALPILLILVGLMFLLDSLHLVPFRQIGRFWPVLLIAAGVLMLNSRLSIKVDKRPFKGSATNSSWTTGSTVDVAGDTTTHEQ